MNQPQWTALVVSPSSSPSDRSSEFVPVTGGGESASAGGLLIAAYILMWACAFGLIALSIKKLGQVGRRIDELETKLAQKDAESQAQGAR